MRVDKKASQDSHLSADDLCRIIDTCATRGVGEFRLGEFEIKFGRKESLLDLPHEQVSGQIIFPETDHVEEERLAVESDELRLKEEQVAMLILEDPEEFERQIASGELEDMLDDDGSGFESERSA